MEALSSAKRPSAIPVCERCRRRRQKCDTDNLNPCRPCVNAGLSECLISEPDGQVSIPRTYVRSLEDQSEHLRQQIQALRNQLRQQSAEAQVANQGHPIPETEENLLFPSPGGASDSLIENLFSHTRRAEDSSSKVKSLVQDLGQVSLAALSTPAAGQSSTDALSRIILSAAAASTMEVDERSEPLPLPDISIAQRVCSRYCQDILPGFPFINASDILLHLRLSYQSEAPYSVFMIATMLATTAVFLSPNSIPNAIGLYRTGLFSLEHWFDSKGGADMLQSLEAVVALGQFASIVGERYGDAWGLAGMAVRIAVDLGFHKICDTGRKRRLFWSAYSLDRRMAIIDDLPVAVSDRAIDAEIDSDDCHPFRLYQLLSEIHDAKEPVASAWQDGIKVRLDQWYQKLLSYNPIFPRRLQSDYFMAITKLQDKLITSIR